MVNKFLSKFTREEDVFGVYYALESEIFRFDVSFESETCRWWLVWKRGRETGELKPLWSEEATVRAAYSEALSALQRLTQEFSDAIDDA
jgi:hypothetical protein